MSRERDAEREQDRRDHHPPECRAIRHATERTGRRSCCQRGGLPDIVAVWLRPLPRAEESSPAAAELSAAVGVGSEAVVRGRRWSWSMSAVPVFGRRLVVRVRRRCAGRLDRGGRRRRARLPVASLSWSSEGRRRRTPGASASLPCCRSGRVPDVVQRPEVEPAATKTMTALAPIVVSERSRCTGAGFAGVVAIAAASERSVASSASRLLTTRREGVWPVASCAAISIRRTRRRTPAGTPESSRGRPREPRTPGPGCRTHGGRAGHPARCGP